MIRRLISLVLLLCTAQLVRAQANDGFQRRDGAMYLIRNGEVRPMTRDIRLPNGRLVTRDGFVVTNDGQRTELKDGQGCSLLGMPVTANAQANGRVVLATSGTRSASSAIEAQAAEWRWRESRNKGKGRGKGKYKRKHHKNDD